MEGTCGEEQEFRLKQATLGEIAISGVRNCCECDEDELHEVEYVCNGCYGVGWCHHHAYSGIYYHSNVCSKEKFGVKTFACLVCNHVRESPPFPEKGILYCRGCESYRRPSKWKVVGCPDCGEGGANLTTCPSCSDVGYCSKHVHNLQSHFSSCHPVQPSCVRRGRYHWYKEERCVHCSAPEMSDSVKALFLAQCGLCKKWRKLPHDVNTHSLPEQWNCSMSTWGRLSCGVE
jgi:hypothetical protein